jgi:hypothetical protein
MAPPHLTLKWHPYEELIWEIYLEASNGSFSATQRFYEDPESLASFAKELSSFPTQPSREVRFELGSLQENWAYYILLRAYLYDRVGHAAIEIAVDNREAADRAARASFHIRCEVAAINRLGKALQNWVANPSEGLVWTPT